ncbi:single-stranded-DNA-specific exonuclease RecJ [Lactiplantibacillus mudanjiangensis]|uniref:Single-stranded-DNA-specific exonuclease RecJ n=1 Tax=Lactiplantibacillus mudanjiangensis TaxID=1296538 RepID=A0A660E2Z7_9LACO|nr:single-stranded-DNA-specific exonuclease RecJ [Lactiplantibacillus mudanjiangensis]VDG24160.1 single-stranded-DNA-specific exonuclease RecJ [Lactobacillus pentosus] [Lactiplantibacillus mudanjiangensis]VDG30144.1 single-stranded-DNA-specific exonuclease RecJ [Lactobacillus pentosus] [Lactiplantibacillus mudanjiangensis]
MLAAKKHWVQPTPTVDETAVTALAEAVSVTPLVARLLITRGITTPATAKIFLQADQQPLNDPLQMHDMQKAIDRIQDAIVAGDQITVYGDYDADGLTSTSIMVETLDQVGAQVNYYIPDRFKDGYGPNQAAFDHLIEAGTKLFVTVDNGVAGNDVINAVQERGIDVVVTDHHELPAELPDAYAIVHPRHPEGHYPFGELSGAGVAFKVATALLEEVPEELLDLAAIGTVADLVSLTGENRTLVTLGLKVLQQTTRPGLSALIKAAGLDNDQLDATSIGFGIAPRLNALGRLQSAQSGVELLTTLDDERATSLATTINQLNDKRQGLVRDIADSALAQAQLPENQARQTLVITGKDWHEGVLGIVASRLVEATGKPTLVLNEDADGRLKGSGRSIDAYNLFAAIDPIRDDLVAFGGHHMAVGLTVMADQLSTLKEALETAATANDLAAHAQATLQVDGVLPLSEATLETLAALQPLAPFGTDNPAPVFEIDPTEITQVRAIGADKQHLKLQLSDGTQNVDAIAFSMGTAAGAIEASPTNVKVVGELSANTWNGQTKPQVMVKDLAVTGSQVIDARTQHLTAHQFNQPGVYVFFHQNLMKRLTDYLNDHSQAVLASDQAALAAVTDQSVFIVDCPDTLADLTDVLQQLPLNQVTLYLYRRESLYLAGMPNREQFGKLYKFTLAHHDVDIHHQLSLVAGHLHLQRNLLIFMIQVFFEVGFVKINDGVMNGVSNPQKADLHHAPSYQLREQQIAAEETLLYSKSAALQTWVKNQAAVKN